MRVKWEKGEEGEETRESSTLPQLPQMIVDYKIPLPSGLVPFPKY